MRKDKKKVILTMIMIVSIVTFFFVSKNILNKKEEKLPEVRLNNKIEKNKTMAIMVTNDNGIGYKEYEGNKWPEGYNFKKAECVDNKGAKVEEALTYDSGRKEVVLETNKTVYCTLYFDREKTILDKLRENDSNKVISTELVGDLYRYQGVGTEEGIDATHKLVDNNYICFGTNNEGECKDNPDKYMYRIIGVTTNNELKVIKMTGVEEGGFDYFTWNDRAYVNSSNSAYCENGICPEWNESLIFKRINGLSNGSTSGSGFASSDKGDTDIFINNKNYPYMVEGNYWYNLIDDHNWMYGTVVNNTKVMEVNGENLYGTNNDGITIWKIETGQIPTAIYIGNSSFQKYEWNKEKNVKAKIGLMYLHDYYLAYDNTTDWSFWSGNYSTNNWIFAQNNKNDKTLIDWTMTERRDLANTDVSYFAYPIKPDGTTSDYRITISGYIRPVFYIKSGIELEGKGTEESPYIISLQKNENNQIYYDYEYREDIREFVAPEAGIYKLEVWGAQGGGNEISSGKGGYASGYITLTKGQKLYLVVGGQGSGIAGGYNGGGNADTMQLSNITAGGGATHIATSAGLLKDLSNNKQSVLIVAGGGGGGRSVDDLVKGGNAGGVVGDNGVDSVNPTWIGFAGLGGTATEAGTCPTGITGDCGGFGYGGSATGQTFGGAGGGAGYYGGSQSSRGHAGAGGGSSYTGGVTAYNGDQPKNISGSEEQPSPKGENQTGNSGNGYARITKID